MLGVKVTLEGVMGERLQAIDVGYPHRPLPTNAPKLKRMTVSVRNLCRLSSSAYPIEIN